MENSIKVTVTYINLWQQWNKVAYYCSLAPKVQFFSCDLHFHHCLSPWSNSGLSGQTLPGCTSVLLSKKEQWQLSGQTTRGRWVSTNKSLKRCLKIQGKKYGTERCHFCFYSLCMCVRVTENSTQTGTCELCDEGNLSCWGRQEFIMLVPLSLYEIFWGNQMLWSIKMEKKKVQKWKITYLR